MPKNVLRIVIPRKIDELLKLAGLIFNKHLLDGVGAWTSSISRSGLIFNKHLLDGANSPLRTLSDYNWDEHGPKLQQAIAKHAEAEEYRRRMEQAYRERDLLMEDVDGLIKSSRDLLKGMYKKTPKKLGEWGFEVNDTPRPGKPE